MDELEPETHHRRLVKAIAGAMTSLKMAEWAETQEGIDKLQDWFDKYPQHYDLTHVKLNTEEEYD